MVTWASPASYSPTSPRLGSLCWTLGFERCSSLVSMDHCPLQTSLARARREECSRSTRQEGTSFQAVSPAAHFARSRDRFRRCRLESDGPHSAT
eukprot:498086-Prymnesium_polylepis.1